MAGTHVTITAARGGTFDSYVAVPKRAFARNGRYDLEQGMRDLSDVVIDLTKPPDATARSP